MNLSEELLAVLQRAKESDEYFNPWIISGVLNAIRDGCPTADTLITDEMDKWAVDMWGQ